MNDNKIAFIVYGVFFSIMPVVYLFNFFTTGTPPPILTFYSLIIIAVMSFCFSYLAPNFSKNDQPEKRRIIRKGIITGFIILVIGIGLSVPLIALNLVEIHFFHLFLIMVTLLVSSAFISVVGYTKKTLRQSA